MKKFTSLLLLAMMTIVAHAGTTWTLNGSDYKVDTLYHAKVGPGTTQTSLQLTGAKNLRVFYTTTDLSDPYVDMRVTKAGNILKKTATVPAMATSNSTEGATYFAGVNGDFFNTSNGQPNGTNVLNSEIYNYGGGVNWLEWSIDANKTPHLGQLTFSGNVTKADGTQCVISNVNTSRGENHLILYSQRNGTSTSTNQYGTEVLMTPIESGANIALGKTVKMKVSGTPSTAGNMTIPKGSFVLSGHGTSSTFVAGLTDGDEVEVYFTATLNGKAIDPVWAIGGCPVMIKNNEIQETCNSSIISHLPANEPRSAIGYDATGTKVVLMVVDGRSSISGGCNTKTLAYLMQAAGCSEAMNFDGGGSSTLYVKNIGNNGVVNIPSESSLRPVTNAVYAVALAPTDNEIAEIRFVDWAKVLPKYGQFTPMFYGYNKYGVLVNTNVQGVTLSCSAELGEIQDDGTTLYGNGSGCHALTATYNGIEAKIAVTVEGNEPYFKHSHALLDGYKEFTCEVLSDVEDTQLLLDNSIFTWSSDDESIATVDEAGVIKGVANGTTNIRIKVDNVEKVLPVTVEIPETHYLAFDAAPDASTWTLTPGTGISAATLSAEGSTLAVDFTVGSSGAKSLTFAKTINSWARPDSIILDVNPHDATVKVVTVYYENALGEEKQSRKANSGFKKNVVNRLTFPVDKFLDATDMSAYPFKFTRLYMTLGDAAGTTGKIEVKNIAMSYNDVPLEPSGIESVGADGNGNSLVLTPNPVVAGTPVKLGVSTAVKYTVSALNGAVVAQGEGTEIPTSGLAAGLYIVKAAERTAKLMVK